MRSIIMQISAVGVSTVQQNGKRMRLQTATLFGACIFSGLFVFPAMASDACFADQKAVLFASCAGASSASSALVGDDGAIPDLVTLPEGGREVIVTGAYTSGEKREPEGMFIINGEVVDPYPQGWDGLMLIDRAGRLSLHHVERVTSGDDEWDLRTKWSRKAFVKAAKSLKWSVFQSHLVVVDGKVDTKPREAARKFRRRILFTLRDGSYGIYETPPMTLHDSAVDVAERFEPEMALNLDMGTFNYCRETLDEESRDCGAVPPAFTGILSNLLVLRQKPADEEPAVTVARPRVKVRANEEVSSTPKLTVLPPPPPAGHSD